MAKNVVVLGWIRYEKNLEIIYIKKSISWLNHSVWKMITVHETAIIKSCQSMPDFSMALTILNVVNFITNAHCLLFSLPYINELLDWTL